MSDWATQGSLPLWTESPCSAGGWGKDRSTLLSDPRKKCETSDTLADPLLNIPALRQWAVFTPSVEMRAESILGASHWEQTEAKHTPTTGSPPSRPLMVSELCTASLPPPHLLSVLPSPQFSEIYPIRKCIYYLLFHSVLTGTILRTEEPGGLQSLGSQSQTWLAD